MDVIERLRRRIAAVTAARASDPTAGGVPIGTVSGVASTTAGMIEWFDRNTTIAVITTKSYQTVPNPGYPEPIITEVERGSFVNAVGLRNPGIETGVGELTELRRRSAGAAPPAGMARQAGVTAPGHYSVSALLNVSISGRNADEFVAMAVTAAPVADLLELNYSCPHATKGYGADIGRDRVAIASITRAVVKAVPEIPVLVKLTPNVPRIGEFATVAIEAGATGIAAINTVGPVSPRHAGTDTTILANPRGGMGGKSGAWIFDAACEGVANIRRAIGERPVIIGMGGVSTRDHVDKMRRAGADVVGVGSALAGIHQRYWAAYLAGLSVKADAPAPAGGSTSTTSPASIDRPPGNRNTYRRFAVAETRELGDGFFELSLDGAEDSHGAIECGPGQTVFLWLPGVGEKPFAPALGEPVTFLIKRRGRVTRALGALRPGDAVFVRGPYGDVHTPSAHTRVLLVGGGSGAAALPALARLITGGGGAVTTLVGLRHPIAEGAVEQELARYGPTRYITDDEDGGVLNHVAPVMADFCPDAVYLVGPEAFMAEGVRRIRGTGGASPVMPAATSSAPAPVLSPSSASPHIFLSLERSMRCGIGVCGECHHHGRLTCQFGTIVRDDEGDTHD